MIIIEDKTEKWSMNSPEEFIDLVTDLISRKKPRKKIIKSSSRLALNREKYILYEHEYTTLKFPTFDPDSISEMEDFDLFPEETKLFFTGKVSCLNKDTSSLGCCSRCSKGDTLEDKINRGEIEELFSLKNKRKLLVCLPTSMYVQNEPFLFLKIKRSKTGVIQKNDLERGINLIRRNTISRWNCDLIWKNYHGFDIENYIHFHEINILVYPDSLILAGKVSFVTSIGLPFSH